MVREAKSMPLSSSVLVNREELLELIGDMRDAREHARQTRLEAEDYVDAKLAQFEITLQRLQESLQRTQEALGESVERIQHALSRTADQVTSGRERLRGLGHPAQELAPEEESQP